jgi:catechol 2,3-dioxygenase-like lactoylglutathione lyase family enzyme
MKLNHLSLAVADIAATRAFFEQFFGFTCVDVKGDEAIAVLTGTDGYLLVLSRDKNETATYPTDFHIGFLVSTEEEVNEKYRELKGAGLPVPQEPRHIRGSLAFYFYGPNNIMIEVSHAA